MNDAITRVTEWLDGNRGGLLRTDVRAVVEELRSSRELLDLSRTVIRAVKKETEDQGWAEAKKVTDLLSRGDYMELVEDRKRLVWILANCKLGYEPWELYSSANRESVDRARNG